MTAHANTEQAALYISSVTFVVGGSMAALLTNPKVTIPGVALAVVSAATFALVHCIRVNRKRRERHQKQEIC
jgi:threonine/homoserine efflux transporter RhtA